MGAVRSADGCDNQLLALAINRPGGFCTQTPGQLTDNRPMVRRDLGHGPGQGQVAGSQLVQRCLITDGGEQGQLSDLAGFDRLIQLDQLYGRISPERAGGHRGMGGTQVDTDQPDSLG